MNLLPFFQMVEESGLGRAVRESVWAFAVIESVHLLALAMMGGAVLLVDMRMLNIGHSWGRLLAPPLNARAGPPLPLALQLF